MLLFIVLYKLVLYFWQVCSLKRPWDVTIQVKSAEKNYPLVQLLMAYVYQTLLFFLIFFIYIQVVPILLHLVKAISSVRLYIPKDLRSLDSRQSVGKSIKVSTYIYDQIEISRNQVVKGIFALSYIRPMLLIPIREFGKFLRV